MAARMSADNGTSGGKNQPPGSPASSSDDFASLAKLTNSKDFLQKYNENELRNAASLSSHRATQQQQLSPRLAASASPNSSSEGSIGRHSGASPYSALGTSFTPNAYLAAAAVALAQQQQQQAASAQQQQVAAAAQPSPSSTPGATSNDILSKDLFTRFNPALAAAAAASAALPGLAPISPLSSAAAAAATMQRLLLQNSPGTAALFGKSLSELQKLQAEQQQQQQALLATRYAAIMKGVLAPSGGGATSPSPSKDMDFYGDTPEQDGPIDLSMKRRLASLTEALNLSTQAQHMTIGDHDSGFSPSSNEDNVFHNQSGSSFLSKFGARQHRSKIALDLTGNSACNDSDEHVDVDDYDDEDEHCDDDADLEHADSGSVDIDVSSNTSHKVSKDSRSSSPKATGSGRAQPSHSVRRQEIECAP